MWQRVWFHAGNWSNGRMRIYRKKKIMLVCTILLFFFCLISISTPALTALPLDFISINNAMCNCWAAREEKKKERKNALLENKRRRRWEKRDLVFSIERLDCLHWTFTKVQIVRWTMSMCNLTGLMKVCMLASARAAKYISFHYTLHIFILLCFLFIARPDTEKRWRVRNENEGKTFIESIPNDS